VLASLQKRTLPQPTVAGVLTSGVALLIWQLRCALVRPAIDLHGSTIAIALAISLIAANAVTIQISYHTKTTLSDSVLLLISVLLPPIGSLLVALGASLLSLTLHKRQRSLYWSDILTDSGRFGLIGFVASAVYHALAPIAWDFWDRNAASLPTLMRWLAKASSLPAPTPMFR